MSPHTVDPWGLWITWEQARYTLLLAILVLSIVSCNCILESPFMYASNPFLAFICNGSSVISPIMLYLWPNAIFLCLALSSLSLSKPLPNRMESAVSYGARLHNIWQCSMVACGANINIISANFLTKESMDKRGSCWNPKKSCGDLQFLQAWESTK